MPNCKSTILSTPSCLTESTRLLRTCLRSFREKLEGVSDLGGMTCRWEGAGARWRDQVGGQLEEGQLREGRGRRGGGQEAREKCMGGKQGEEARARGEGHGWTLERDTGALLLQSKQVILVQQQPTNPKD